MDVAEAVAAEFEAIGKPPQSIFAGIEGALPEVVRGRIGIGTTISVTEARNTIGRILPPSLMPSSCKTRPSRGVKPTRKDQFCHSTCQPSTVKLGPLRLNNVEGFQASPGLREGLLAVIALSSSAPGMIFSSSTRSTTWFFTRSTTATTPSIGWE